MRNYSTKRHAVYMRRYLAENPAAKAKMMAKNKRWKEANRDRMAYLRLRSHLRRVFGISVEQYNDMLIKQSNLCAICRRPPPNGRRFEVDHDHKTGIIRGLLCGNCNRGIGLLSESPLVLRLAAAYLEI